jgi:hypothetical protein
LGEKVAGYEIRVFNEREVRAAAGIVFLFAFIAFMNGFLTGNNAPTKLMVSVVPDNVLHHLDETHDTLYIQHKCQIPLQKTTNLSIRYP